MDNNNGKSNAERILEQAAAAGGDRAGLERFLHDNPQFAPLLSSAKPEDFARMQQVLSSPALTKKILATAKAQQILDAIKKGKRS